MTTSRGLAVRKVERFEKNITKRGAIPETSTKKGNDYPVGPILLGFFIFVVVGSCRQRHDMEIREELKLHGRRVVTLAHAATNAPDNLTAW